MAGLEWYMLEERWLYHLPGGALLVANLNDGILDHLQVRRVGCSSFPRIGSISGAHLDSVLKELKFQQIAPLLHNRYFPYIELHTLPL